MTSAPPETPEGVTWHPYSFEDRATTAPPEDELVWIMEESREPHTTIGYFDGFTFRLWSGTDDCDVTHWAPMTYPQAPAATSEADERRPHEWRPAPDVRCLACRTAGNVEERPEYGISPYDVRPVSPDGTVTMYPTGRTVYYCTACRAEWIDPPR